MKMIDDNDSLIVSTKSSRSAVKERKEFPESLITQNDSVKNKKQHDSNYCVIDRAGNRFSCIHSGNCQHKPNCIKSSIPEKNIDFHQLRFHPGDRQLWCQEVFPDILRLIDWEMDAKNSDYKIVFNHRYLKEDGDISQFMHEGSIVFTRKKLLPVLTLKAFFEITDKSPDGTILLSIFRNTGDFGFHEIFYNEYGQKSCSLLTERELEIIQHFYQGMSSKMIAEKLNLSVHTVKNHKRNCMEKTTTHSITELIHYCLKNNWLQ